MLALGTNTDPYQPIERKMSITRGMLEVLARIQPSGRHRHQIGAGAARHRYPGADMARQDLASVTLSVTTLDRDLARVMEPRAATPSARLETIRQLAECRHSRRRAGRADDPGAQRHGDGGDPRGRSRGRRDQRAAMSLLRLPLEIKDLFAEWLEAHAPGKAKHVMSLIRQMRARRALCPQFGERMRGTGPYADLLATGASAGAANASASTSRRTELAHRPFRVAAEAGRADGAVLSLPDSTRAAVDSAAPCAAPHFAHRESHRGSCRGRRRGRARAARRARRRRGRRLSIPSCHAALAARASTIPSRLPPEEREEVFAWLPALRRISASARPASRRSTALNILRASHAGHAPRRRRPRHRARHRHWSTAIPRRRLPLPRALRGRRRRAFSLSIAAASIVAKVTRDRLMMALAERYPGYGWERNVGYGTPEHRPAHRPPGHYAAASAHI